MRTPDLLAPRIPQWILRWWGFGLAGVLCGLLGCNEQGQSTAQLSPPPVVTPQLEQQAVTRLLELYHTAVLQEDIDRLQDLLAPPLQPPAGVEQARCSQRPSCPQDVGVLVDTACFQEMMSATFCTGAMLAHTIFPETLAFSDDRTAVTFLEGESIEDTALLVQQTRVFRTTLHFLQDTANGVATIRIAAVQRQGPLWQATTRGQIMAGATTRVEVVAPAAPSALARVEITGPGIKEDIQQLVATGQRFHGRFTPLVHPTPQPLQVRVYTSTGEVMTFSHRYRRRILGEGVIQRVAGTRSERLLAIAVAPDGTVWSGGDARPDGVALYRVQSGATEAQPVPVQLTNSTGRVEDLLVDDLGRLHVIVLASGSATLRAQSQDVVFDQGISCPTVNVFDSDQHYPLKVRNLQTGAPVPSPSTRASAAAGGDIWLFGSDGGVARVTDTFHGGVCPDQGIKVEYNSVWRRQSSALLTNTVPALVAGRDGTLWLGTALGLMREREGQFTPVLFRRDRTVQGDIATLEALFPKVAEAIFLALPHTTVAVGNVSFTEAFGRQALVKEDFIFSAVEDAQGRLWVGTLGGGLRWLEGDTQTLPLTRQDGLSSNIILALAVGPDASLWVGTDEGVNRLQERAGEIVLTTFGAVDGLALPVRDIAVSADGVPWLATDGGLFRILPQGERLQGMVRDTASHPVDGVDVIVQGTPFRAVTDATGHFELTNLPVGQQTLRFESPFADGAPFTAAFRTVEITNATRMLEVVVVPLAPRVPVDLTQGGSFTFPNAPGIRLDIPSQALHLPPGEAPALGLTPLPLDNLPLPLPAGFTAVAAVDVQPAGAVLTALAQLTVPNTAQLPAGRLVVLLRLNEAVPEYEEVGCGRVQDDGSISGGLSSLSVVVFATTAVTDEAQLGIVGGDGQHGLMGQALPNPLVVSVQDRDGRGIPGVPITFTVRSGEGTVANATVLTNPQGQASTVLVLGIQAGINTVTVTAPCLARLTFTATGAAARLLQVSGNNQLGAPGEVLPEPLVVRLEDQFGNRVAGAEVRATITAGPGTLIDPRDQHEVGNTSTAVTDAQGEARFGLRVDANALQGEEIQVQIAARALPNPTQSEDFHIFVGLGSAFGLAVEPRGTLVVADPGLAAVVRVDPAQGTHTLVSRSPSCVQSLVSPVDIATDADGTLWVVDVLVRAVVRVDADRGDCTIVSGVDPSSRQFIGGGDPPFGFPVAIEAHGGTLFVGDVAFPAVIRVDPQSGDRRIVSGSHPITRQLKGEGLPFVYPAGIAVQADGTLLVGDPVLDVVMQVDPDSGDRRIVSGVDPSSGKHIGNGPPLKIPASIVLNTDSTLMVADRSRRAVVQVDLRRGDRTTFSGELRGDGPPLQLPEGIAVMGDGTLVVGDISLGVVQVNPGNGNREVVSAIPTRPPFLPVDIAVEEAKNTLVVVDPVLKAVVRVERVEAASDAPPQYERTIVSGRDPKTGDRVGRGPPLGFPFGIAVENTGTFVVVDPTLGVVQVDPQSGNRRIVSGPDPDPRNPLPIGDGPLLAFPRGIAIETENSLLVVTDLALFSVVRVGRMSGDRRIVSGFDLTTRKLIGDGPLLGFPLGIAVEADGRLVVVDAFLRAVVRVHPKSGDRTIVSGFDTKGKLIGRGPLLQLPFDLAIEADGTLVVADDGLDAVVRVDPHSGDRTIVSGFDPTTGKLIGRGPSFGRPFSIAVADTRTLVVGDTFRQAVIRVDLGSGIGDRTVISSR